MLRVRGMRRLQRFASVHASVQASTQASVHASGDTHFHPERSLSPHMNFKLNRAAAFAKGRGIGASSTMAHCPF